ncbi:Rab proteins geranylgeranyltransferase component A [Recurvomyces mirabilis]|uniref:Rab proteins geranylgeranyltransferase n=1 Tax=Recurvomyces mirabilis TaxID=574656 RepID=A0AAE0WK53_9PEZI|nr:Rab proteins geranylgeranyltransferase component A [Recurvomyces mirabilis]KAK5153418.1 Rab proteins geranylgeranyltransferase component A [Recurvomyces mirabilis]
MDTLDKTEWDVIIAGTGLLQSLLALSLSRSGKQILHLDHNTYYGGHEAALSLSEAEEWAEKHAGDPPAGARSCFAQASVTKTAEGDANGSKLGFSRAYSLALAPQLIYARSNLLPALVSSRTHNQLDFQAVGSWFVVNGATEEGGQPRILRVPSGREDVFGDDSLDLRAKRSLMKFMRFVASYDEESEEARWAEIKNMALGHALRSKFGLNSDAAITPLLALALVEGNSADLTVEFTVPRIARHFRSIGMFGPGFSAVLPKWGGLAEIAQVACRACAVGGGVYVLGKGIRTATASADAKYEVELSDGEVVTTTWLTGCPDDLPSAAPPSTTSSPSKTQIVNRAIYIISSSLDSLFPPTSEGGPVPAGAVVRVDTGTAGGEAVNVLAHSSDSGECPSGQCVLYTSSMGSKESQDNAIQYLIRSVNEQPEPHVPWKLQYQQYISYPFDAEAATTSNIICLPPLSADIVLGDEVLDAVQHVWQQTTGVPADSFMKFVARGEESVEEQDTM